MAESLASEAKLAAFNSLAAAALAEAAASLAFVVAPVPALSAAKRWEFAVLALPAAKSRADSAPA